MKWGLIALYIVVVVWSAWYFVSPRGARPDGSATTYSAVCLLPHNHRLREQDLSAGKLSAAAFLRLPPKNSLAGKYVQKPIYPDKPVEPANLTDAPSAQPAAGQCAQIVPLTAQELVVVDAGSKVKVVVSTQTPASADGSVLAVICENISSSNCSALVQLSCAATLNDPKSMHLVLSQ